MDQFEHGGNVEKNQVVAAQSMQIAANNPMAMIAAAVAKGVDTEQLTKLMDLQERWEKNEARKAFSDAMVAFKAEPITIDKNKDVYHNGKYMYSHATLDNICRQIIAALQKHGIAHTWRVSQSESRIKVACVLRHRMGHEETVELEGAPDTSGAKNAIQAMASTVSYLQRYSLMASTGLAAGMDDDDGAGGGESGLTDAQRKAFDKSINEAKTADGLTDAWKVIVKACNEAKDKEAYADYKNKVSIRGAELTEAA